MDFIGFELGKVSRQVCIITGDGELFEHRLLIEASTESEWVAHHLDQLGHEVVIADTNFAPVYATLSRKVKTDKRDARTLAEARRLGAYRTAHRAPDRQRHVRTQLAVRDTCSTRRRGRS